MKSLKEKMANRKIARLCILKRFIKGGEVEGDWVTIGVLISKSSPKTSKNGKQFSVWKLNDLSPHCPTVGLFLFGRSHEDHWKTVEGSVVGLLNAKVMPQKDNSSNELSLSVDNSQKLIVLGKSKDLGWCKGKRKDGASCTMFVNKADSEWCDFHIQSQYKKQCAKRTDLQASFSGLNPTAAMKKATQNVIYGGKMFNATRNRSQPKNPNKKMILKSLGAKYADFIQEELKPKCVTLLGKDKLEDDTLVSVSGATKEFHSLLSKPTPGSQNFIRHMVEAEKAKDAVPVAAADLIKQHKLQINSSIKMRKASLENSRAGSSNKENNLCLSNGISGKSRNKGLIDLDVDTQQDSFKSKSSARMTREELAKAKAVALIKRKGKLEKKDPNETQKTKKPLDERALKEIRKRTEANRKSSSDETTEGEEPQKKKRKVVFGEVVDLDSDEMKEVLGATSIYEGALEVEMEERYFSQMEAKEKLELRMDAIKEKQCKVVSCKQCKFTWFCASSLCKAENHKLFWHEATQRFFKCYDCNTRTITFFRYPTRHCRNCRSGKFVRVSMLNVREKDDNPLLLRGEERKWVM
ncbi:Protein MCM10-like [Holothuria leucospilota]|uniref:Protein MCM10 homolog n=1 Tax=Holothuria leucospilota TaxID=206669 RepID=A0A9Q1HEG7_HOLLE|nr:Protein MCM10-like [Holothuria leucospilota]